MLQRLFWPLFWNLYALVYDTLSLLAPYRRLMAEQVAAAAPAAGERVLDAGCGTGNLIREIERAGRNVDVLGVDRAGAMLSRARSKALRAELRPADLAATLPFAGEQFDVALCSNVLYTVPDPLHTLRELHRVLRPGGRLVVANPRVRANLQELVMDHVRSGRGAAHWVRFALLLPLLALVVAFNLVIVAFGPGKQTMHFTDAEELQALLQQAGFEGVELRPAYAGQCVLARGRRPAPARRGVETAA